MGYLLDQMEKVAYFVEEAMMEKLALTREQAKAKRKAARLANKAGRIANKAVAGSMQGGNLAQAAAQLGVDVSKVADMTPSNIARTLEKGQGKGLLKAVQNAVTGGGSVADVIPHAPGAGYEDLQNMLKSREGVIDSLAGARDEAVAKANSYSTKLWRALWDADKVRKEKWQLQDLLDIARNDNAALRADKLKLSNQAAQLTDDLANFKNLGRFAGAAKWISGNPKKALGAAILGGGGLLGGAGAAGYALNDYYNPQK